MFVYLAPLLLVIFYLYYHLVHKRRGLPPGPTPLPFLGNVLSIINDPPGEKVFARWRREYGNVYTYWMGNIPVVFIADYNLIVEAFQKDSEILSGRPDFPEFEMMIRGVRAGMSLVDGDIWKEQRRFALKILRDFGVSRNLIQDRVLDEVLTIFETCDKSIESGVEEQNLFAEVEISVGSLINAFLFGYRFHGERREEFFRLKKLLVNHLDALGHPLVQMSMDSPYFYKHLPFFRHYILAARDTAIELMNFFSKQIDEHNTDFDYDKESSDYVHAFMYEWRRLDAAGEKHYFSHQQLLGMCYDLWLSIGYVLLYYNIFQNAGQSTVATTISWGCAFLIHKPDVQQKCQQELDRVIGSDRLITLKDKPNLPYCNATIEETYRVANITPQVFWHRALDQLEVGGYVLKKDILTMPQFSAYFIDEKLFKNPHDFNPDRFMDEEGNFKRMEEQIPFGIGKRVCVGESMARTQIFLIITNLLNRYKLSSGKQPPSLKRKLGFAVLIDPYTCRMEKRI